MVVNIPPKNKLLIFLEKVVNLPPFYFYEKVVNLPPKNKILIFLGKVVNLPPF